MASLKIQICFLIFYASIYISTHRHGLYCLPEDHTALFIFRDSIFDVGNNNYINTTTDYQANFWPYGETSLKYPTGRFSDGRLIPDFMAEYAKLPFIPPYLQPGCHQYTDGANFASAGAGVLVETHHGFVIDLKSQLEYFKNVKRLLKQQLGDAETRSLLSKAIYLFSIGGNDYLVPFLSNSTMLQMYPGEAYVDMVIGNLTTVIKVTEYADLPLIPSYLHPGYRDQYIYGVNFASGGAGALDEITPGKVVALNTQVNYFKMVNSILTKKLGNAEAKILLSKAVHIFNIGSNDYGARFLTKSTVFLRYSQKEFVDIVIGKLTGVIKEIYGLDGRKFGFNNVPPIGCSPVVRIRVNGSKGACHEELLAAARLHNKALIRMLQKLEKQLKGFKYSVTDLYRTVEQVMKCPSKYGFKEGNVACCGGGHYRRDSSCGGKRGITKYELCKNPCEYLFFDSAHPTDRANQHFAQLMWSGNRSVTKPYNLKELFEV